MDVPAPSGASPRALKEQYAKALKEKYLREERKRQSNPYGGLMEFIRYFWHVLEPVDPFVDGWPLECLCAHLEAITGSEIVNIDGEEKPLNRLVANVPPGFMKSLCVQVFWKAWEWGPMGLPHLRYVSFSYSPTLTERDNAKFRDLICSEAYREMWGHVFNVVGDGKIMVTNDKTGSSLASSFGSVGTGIRGHRVILDDPHALKGTAESPEARLNVTTWVREAMQNRLNDLRRDAIVIIMQRLYEDDACGEIRKHLPKDYCHLVIPMEYESGRHFSHYLGWNDGQDPRQYDGELAWEDRYPANVLESYKANSYLWAGQYQQRPSPRGGGLFKEDWWQYYEVPLSGVYDFIPIFTLASVDTAFKEKQHNDYSALVVISAYDHPKTGNRCLMMVDAWKKRLPLHGERVQRHPDEDERAYLRRCAPKWGLTEWVNFTCSKRKVDRLLIEDSARGHDVAAELKRLYANSSWGTRLVPARGDKWSRAHSVVDIFTDEMVYAPGGWVCSMHGKTHCKQCGPDLKAWVWRDWAQDVIVDMGLFPKGQHDDVVDAVVMALRHLRDTNIAIRREERALEEEDLARQRPSTNSVAGDYLR